MRMNLSDEEARILKELLRDYLPELRREVARTEVRDLRHVLIERQELCERMLEVLEEQPH